MVGASLRIGRGTDCAIHLPDPRVMFLHATMRPSDHGGFAVHGNGKVVQSVRGFETVVRASARQPRDDRALSHRRGAGPAWP